MSGLEIIQLFSHGVKKRKCLENFLRLFLILGEFLHPLERLPNADVDTLSHVFRRGSQDVTHAEWFTLHISAL
jgi:hypothetical protein